MKILITGCAGFIGSHLTESLLVEGHFIFGIDNFDEFYDPSLKEDNVSLFLNHSNFELFREDITNESFWDSFDQQVDLVIHLAAKAGVLPSLIAPMDYSRTNILGTQLVLDWMNKRKIKRIIFGSSSSVYGNSTKAPFSEASDISNPISNYAFTKVSGEILMRTYFNQYGIKPIILRFFTVIGERQRPDLAINKFTRLIRNNQQINMYGDGTTTRDYTYVGDIVSGIKSAIQEFDKLPNQVHIFNLGSSNPVSLKKLIETLFTLINTQSKVIELPMQNGDVNHTFADISNANEYLNYVPSTDFETGIRKFLDWYSVPS